jgi:hypothetical protein
VSLVYNSRIWRPRWIRRRNRDRGGPGGFVDRGQGGGSDRGWGEERDGEGEGEVMSGLEKLLLSRGRRSPSTDCDHLHLGSFLRAVISLAAVLYNSINWCAAAPESPRYIDRYVWLNSLLDLMMDSCHRFLILEWCSIRHQSIGL